MDNKITLTIQSIFKGEGFTKATQATSKLSKDVKDAGGAVKDLAGSMGQLGGSVGKAAGGVSKLMGLMGAGPLGIVVAGVTAIVGAFVKWRNTMREVEQKMNDLARNRHEDMWQRMHRNIAKAAKAQADFFDEAIEKGGRLLAYAKQEQQLRNQSSMAQAEKKAHEIDLQQAREDVKAAKQKTKNVLQFGKTEASEANAYLDMERRKSQINAEQKKEDILHKAKMDALAENKRMIDEEIRQLQNEAQELYKKDDAEKRNAATKRKGYEKEAQDLQNDPEYRQIVKRQARRAGEGYETSNSASRRQRYWDDQRKMEEWQKKIRDKKEEAAKFEEEYAEKNKATMKRQQEIAEKIKQLQIQRSTAETTANDALIQHNIKMQQFRKQREENEAKIQDQAKQEDMKHTVELNTYYEKERARQANIDAQQFKNSEFQNLYKANSKVESIKSSLDNLEHALINWQGKQDLKGEDRQAYLMSHDVWEKKSQELKDAQAELQIAYRDAKLKYEQLRQGGWDIASGYAKSQWQLNYSEVAELAGKIASGGYSKDATEKLKEEMNRWSKQTEKVEAFMLKVAQERTKNAKEGLDKQGALKDELELIRQIQDKNHAALEAIEGNTRERERNDLTGAGRKARRNAEHDAEVENKKLEGRIRAQEKAARRDAQRGWTLDANGNLVRTRGLASGRLSRRQQERLKEYLEKERLKDKQKGLDNKELQMAKQVKASLDNMSKILQNVDTHLLETIKLP